MLSDDASGLERGVVSIPDDEAIRRWCRVPWADRLLWLEEANRFLYLAQPPAVREKWQAMRNGLL